MRSLEDLVDDLKNSQDDDEPGMIDLSTDEAKAIAGSIARRLATLNAGERESLLSFLERIHDSLSLHELRLAQASDRVRRNIARINKGEVVCLAYNRSSKLN